MIFTKQIFIKLIIPSTLLISIARWLLWAIVGSYIAKQEEIINIANSLLTEIKLEVERESDFCGKIIALQESRWKTI